MHRMRDWMLRLTEEADLHGEPMPGLPIVELAGDRRVLIENHGGVTEYGRERIRVRVKYGQICICGCGLEMARMTANQLVIAGQIDSLSVIRRA